MIAAWRVPQEEKKTEYISREAAIKAVSENDCEGYATWAIKSIPAADVQEVKRGKWKKRKGWSRCVCSACSYENGSETNFCPNCGADMREES